MPSNEEIFAKIQEALVDALGVDDDEVTEDATLVGDLGAESIDFLDIIFRLEKAFEILSGKIGNLKKPEPGRQAHRTPSRQIRQSRRYHRRR